MPATKGVTQKAYARKRASKAEIQRKKVAQGRTLESLQAGMGAFLGRSSTSRTWEDDAANKRHRTSLSLEVADVRNKVANEEEILWEQIRQRDRDYTMRRNHK